MAAISTLVDDFVGSSLGAQWVDASFGSLSVGGRTVTLPCLAAYPAFYSASAYDLTGSSISVYIVPMAAGDGTPSFDFTLSQVTGGYPSSNDFGIHFQGGVAYTIFNQGGGQTFPPGGVAATSGMWWRFREASGTVYIDYSSDGVNWTNLSSSTYTMAITSLYAGFNTGYYGGNPSSSVFIAAVNLTPVSPSRSIGDGAATATSNVRSGGARARSIADTAHSSDAVVRSVQPFPRTIAEAASTVTLTVAGTRAIQQGDSGPTDVTSGVSTTPLAKAVTAGSLLIAAIASFGNANDVLTVTSSGDTWVFGGTGVTGGGFDLELWYCLAATGGTKTITVTTTSGTYTMQLSEFPGKFGHFISATNTSGTSTAPAGSAVTTAGELAFVAAGVDDFMTAGPGSPWSFYNASHWQLGEGISTAYAEQATSGTLTATWTSPSAFWKSISLIFSPAVALTRSIGDNAATSTAVVRAATPHARSVADTLATSDAVVRAVENFSRTLGETCSSSTAVVRVSARTRAIAETTATSDAVVRSAAPHARSIAEAAATADTVAVLRFVQRVGAALRLNGAPFRFTGFNLPYQMHDGESLTTALTDWGSYPAVARVFCFQTFNIVAGAINFTALDTMLATFASFGIRVILVLGNNIDGIGGANDDGALKDLAWWQGGSPNGYDVKVQSGSSPAQVVTFRNWVSQIVTRYAENPTVMAWQLINEAQAINDDGTGSESSAYSAMLGFVNDVAALVKSLDPNHLVSLGNILGYNGGPSGQQWTGSQTYTNPPTSPTITNADYQLLLANSLLDIGDYHDYGYPTYPLGIPDSLTAGLIGLDSCLAIGAAVGKPIIVGEDGIDWTPGATINPPISPPTTAERATLFANKYGAMFPAGVAGVLTWSWRNNPQPTDGSDYGMEVGPSDPVLPLMNPAAYVLSRSIADTLTTSDAVARVANFTRTVGESCATSTGVARHLAQARSIADTSSTATSLSSTRATRRAIAETLTTSSALARLHAAHRTLADALATVTSLVAVTHGSAGSVIHDAVPVLTLPFIPGETPPVFNFAIPETMATVDALARIAHFSRTLGEICSTVDAVAPRLARARALNDNCSTVDVTVHTSAVHPRTTAETMATADAVARLERASRFLSDLCATVDVTATSSARARSIADTAATADLVSRFVTFPRTTAETMATTDAVTFGPRSFARSVADAALTIDLVLHGSLIGRAIAEACATVDVTVRSTQSFSKAIAETCATTDVVNRAGAYPRAIADAAAMVDGLSTIHHLSRPLAENCSTSDNVGKVGTFLRSIADTAHTSTGTIGTRGLGRTIVDLSATASNDAVRFAAARTCSDAAATVSSVLYGLPYFRSFADTLTTSTSIAMVVVLVITPAFVTVSDGPLVTVSVSDAPLVSVTVSDSRREQVFDR